MRFAGLAITLVILTCCTSASGTSHPSAAKIFSPTPDTPPSPQPSPQPSGPHDRINYFRFTSLKVAWTTTATRVLRTDDGGTTWHDLTPQGINFGSARSFALDDEHLWVYGLGGEVRTADGGRTWSHVVMASTNGSPYFVDTRRGWLTEGLGALAGSEAVAVLRTDDGGATYTQISQTSNGNDPTPDPSGLKFACNKGYAVFGDHEHGILPELCAGGPLGAYRTADGGSHWTWFAYPGLTNTSGTAGLAEPLYITPTEVITFLDLRVNGLAYLYRSHDGGTTWSSTELMKFTAADFESSTRGWALAQVGLVESIDAGASWHVIDATVPPLGNASVQDLGAGYGAMYDGAHIYATADDAKTLTDITPPLVD
jgi:photosystem II stability/assembly factor-like uncharacterized protein